MYPKIPLHNNEDAPLVRSLNDLHIGSFYYFSNSRSNKLNLPIVKVSAIENDRCFFVRTDNSKNSDLSLSDLGIIPYDGGSWNPSNYLKIAYHNMDPVKFERIKIDWKWIGANSRRPHALVHRPKMLSRYMTEDQVFGLCYSRLLEFTEKYKDELTWARPTAQSLMNHTTSPNVLS